MIIKLLFIFCLSCGLALSLSGCGKSKDTPPVVGTPPIVTRNSPVAPTFESSLAKAQLLYDQGKFSEARDAARSCQPSGVFQHKKVANLKAEIAKAMNASKRKGGEAQNP